MPRAHGLEHALAHTHAHAHAHAHGLQQVPTRLGDGQTSTPSTPITITAAGRWPPPGSGSEAGGSEAAALSVSEVVAVAQASRQAVAAAVVEAMRVQPPPATDATEAEQGTRGVEDGTVAGGSARGAAETGGGSPPAPKRPRTGSGASGRGVVAAAWDPLSGMDGGSSSEEEDTPTEKD